jgi:hypothetical protein
LQAAGEPTPAVPLATAPPEPAVPAPTMPVPALAPAPEGTPAPAAPEPVAEGREGPLTTPVHPPAAAASAQASHGRGENLRGAGIGNLRQRE